MDGKQQVETEQDRRSEHFEVFRKDGGVLLASGRYCTASVTRASSRGDFKLHRGVYLNVRVEDLQDGIAKDGHEAVAREVGLLVMSLVDVVGRDEAKTAEPPVRSDELFQKLEKVWIPSLCRGAFGRFVKRCEVRESGGDGEDRRRYRIYTNNHVYSINAVVKKGDSTYLGCGVSARKPRPGEKHTRGNDLPDGRFDHDTWLKIVHAVVRYELVPLALKPLYQVDEVKEVTKGETGG